MQQPVMPATEKQKRPPRQRGVRYKDDADIAAWLSDVKRADEERFFNFVARLPPEIRAETIVELPAPIQLDLLEQLEPAALIEVMTSLETDDATDLMQLLWDLDPEKGEAVFAGLDERLQGTIRRLMIYEDRQAGSLMQTELFAARANETIQNSVKRLRKLKQQGMLDNPNDVFVVDDRNRLLRVIPLAELILVPMRSHYQDVMEQFPEPHQVEATAPIDEAVRAIERYDLAILPVVDRDGHLLGQITHDDAMDVVQERATAQIYHLAQLSPEEELRESAVETGRSRAFWLAINLFNVTLVSYVIGFFEQAIEAAVALAVLMPIVANMAGTAAVQTLTVVVRQMALGELTIGNAFTMVRKELTIATGNGVLFGLLAMLMSWWRFGSLQLGAVVAIAMGFSMFLAALLGATIPVLLKRFGIDPAVASSTLVITLMDVIGFFSFLALASAVLL